MKRPSPDTEASTVPASVSVLPSEVSAPPAPDWKPDSEALPAFEAKNRLPSGATQQVAAWPVARESSWETVPFGLSAKLARKPALSATTRSPSGSNVTPKGTVPGSELTTGVGDSCPNAPTRKTSMSLPFSLVVTIRLEPSGEKATWPGVFVNCGVAAGFKPSGRLDPGIANRCPKATV